MLRTMIEDLFKTLYPTKFKNNNNNFLPFKEDSRQIGSERERKIILKLGSLTRQFV